MEIRKKRVDEDWKNQAEREKQKMLDQEKAAAGDGDDGEGAPPGTASLVPIFEQIASQAMAGLGQMPDPRTGGRNIDLGMARMTIDLLVSLHLKTKGRLTKDEKTVLEEILQALESGYTQIEHAIAEQQRGGGEGPAGPMGPPPGA